MIRALSVTGFMPFSGVRTWNARTGTFFVENPSLGVEWSVLEIVDVNREPAFDEAGQMALLPDSMRGRWSFAKTDPAGNRWSGVLQWLDRAKRPVFDAIIADTCAMEAYLLADELQRRQSPRPAVISVIHNDAAMHYEIAGEVMQPSCDAVWAVSRHLCATFDAKYPAAPRSRHLPYPVPIANAPPAQNMDGPLRICWCGRVEIGQKRVLDIVPFVAALGAAGVDFQMDVIGDGGAMIVLRAALDPSRNPNGMRVRLLGRLPQEAVLDLLRAQHVLVSFSEFEGTSLSMLEAMGQCLVPVVTDVSSGVTDVITPGKNGWLLPVGDVQGLAQAVARLAADRELLGRARISAWEGVQKTYGAANASHRLAALLTEVCGKPRPPLRLQRLPDHLNRLDHRRIPDLCVRWARAARKIFA